MIRSVHLDPKIFALFPMPASDLREQHYWPLVMSASRSYLSKRLRKQPMWTFYPLIKVAAHLLFDQIPPFRLGNSPNIGKQDLIWRPLDCDPAFNGLGLL